MARAVLQRAEFAGQLLDQMSGIWWVECKDPAEATCTCHPELPARKGLHFYDAVGDLALISDKWGPSVGGGQVRSLRHPEDYPYPDTLRIASELRDPDYNARACLAICEGGARLDKWTPFRHDSASHPEYLAHVGADFELHAGHRRANQWNL